VLRSWLRRQFWIRNLYYNIIASPWLNRFPLYRRLLMKRVRHADQTVPVPSGLSIELTTICDAKCSFCPNDRLKSSTMDLELFKRIARQARELGVRYLTLTGVGETLLDKRLFERLEFLKELDFERISFFTNGSRMTEEKARALLDTPVTHVLFSIDSVDPQRYYDIRKLEFDAVDTNLRRFSAIVSGRIHVAVTSVHEEGGDLSELKKIYQRYGETGTVDLVTFVKAHNWAEGKARDLGEIPCDYLWHNMFVRTDGRMALCCLDWESGEILGDLTREPLAEVIQGALRRVKQLHLEGRKNDIPLCAHCTHIPDWWVNR